MEAVVRRSQISDIPAIQELLSADEHGYAKCFGGNYNLHHIIESSFISVTVLAPNNNGSGSGDDEVVIGFASFSDTAMLNPTIPETTWETYLQENYEHCDKVYSCNAIWLNFFAAAPNQVPFELLHSVLKTVLATLMRTYYFLFALPQDCAPFAPVCDLFQACNRTANNNSGGSAEAEFKGTLYVLHRQAIIPQLDLRSGRVEDYDDLMPLLLQGDGVVTPLPENLYLEELLQQQNAYKAVVVAQDPVSHSVVGLMCLSSTVETQQHVVKQYTTDAYNKLKPTPFHSEKKGQQAGHNVFHITFFYMNPHYESYADQFIPHAFGLFPFAEYAFIYLPHSCNEHALLHNFTYVPIKKFQPTNLQGERLPLPEGMWLISRYTMEPVTILPIRQEHEAAVNDLMTKQSELSQDAAETTCLAVTQSIPLDDGGSAAPPHAAAKTSSSPFASFVVQWRDQIVGVAVLRYVTIRELYALRENFDLDTLLNFTPDGNPDFSESNIALEENGAMPTFFANEIKAVAIKQLYVKPIFRCRIRLLLREILRLSGTNCIVQMAGTESETYAPLLAELVLCRPRRMIDTPNVEKIEGAEDVDPLVVLHSTSRKLLSDEKTKIYGRVVVVGSGTTGLAFMYSLLTIPYLHFGNILLVSQDGLPEHPNHREQLWSVDTMDWMEREYICLKVGKKIRVIESTMIDFDRSDKYIFTENGSCEPYDHLLLTVGRQYAIPKELVSQHGAKNGVFPLANANYIAKIKQHIHESEIYEDELSTAVIYSSNMDAYAVCTCIIQLGLAPNRIVMVSPDTEANSNNTDESQFGDPLIDTKVDKLLESMGIKLYRAYELERLEYDEDNNLTAVVIAPTGHADGKEIELTATMFIYAHEKDIDQQVLVALNKRSIVFDGRVIVENTYRTTDKSIYAAGPVAMFSRRYGTYDEFETFSALEVGKHVAETVCAFLGIDEFSDLIEHKEDDEGKGGSELKNAPLDAELGEAAAGAAASSAAAAAALSDPNRATKRPKPLPQYDANVTKRVVLPSGYQFFTCYTRKYDSISDQCMHLSSSAPTGNNYIRLSISPNKYIEAVSYFGNEPVEMYNFISLVGLPESMLNIVYNYTETKNELGEPCLDIFDYVRQKWAYVAFYDKFSECYREVQKRLAQHPDVQRVRSDLLGNATKEGSEGLTDTERLDAMERISHLHSDARHLVELEVIKMMHLNKAFVPQRYFLPDVSAHVGAPGSLN